ncbi:MAG: hypothetical protein HY873_09480 [Chloroflexi bacterium]|nr:hypothetical protein [Chloroflexota bacterium]
MKMPIGMPLAGLAVITALLAIGCGDNDEMTVAEFINKSYELQLEHEAISGPLHVKFEEGTADLALTDKLPADVTDTLTKLFVEEERFAGQIDSIDAPSGVEDIQTEAVAALKADAAYGREVVTALPNAATLGDLGAAYENEEGIAVETRRENACKAMQQLADDNDIKVGWNC